MSNAPRQEYDFGAYFEHGMTPTDYEIAYRDKLNANLPYDIIDCHVHAGEAASFDSDKMSDFARGHMVSTYPETTIEQSLMIDGLMMPHAGVKKLRFAHAFKGIDHAAVNDYLLDYSPTKDKVALFGISENPGETEYTIEELRTGKYNALKMYYAAASEPRSKIYEYFPPEVLDVAQAEGTPIILHLPKGLERSMDELGQLVEDYPNLQVVLAHIGVTWICPENFDTIMAKVASYPNVSVDTSGVVDVDVIRKTIQHLGAGRVMYGSDEPLNLLREFTYDNPKLGPRILTDYPYHWVDQQEFGTYRHLAPEELTYSQFQQVDSLLVAVRGLAVPIRQRERIIQAIFHDSARERFGF